MPPEMLEKLGVGVPGSSFSDSANSFQPEFVSPFLGAVCHPDGVDASGRLFELGAGYIAEVRWERSNGAIFKTDASFTPSAVKQKWAEVTDFSKPY